MGLLGKGILDFTKSAVGAGATFQQEMQFINALAGGTAQTSQMLQDEATKLDRSTVFSLDDISKGMEQLAREGFTPLQIAGTNATNSLIQNSANMAAALRINMQDASNMLGMTMRAYQEDVSQTAQVTDILTEAALRSGKSADEFNTQLQYVEATAHQLGIPLQDIAAATGELMSQNVPGAGQGLRAFLVGITSEGSKASDELHALGISAFDAQGNFVGLPTIIDELNAALSKLSPGEQSAAIKALSGGNRQVTALIQLLKDGSTGLTDFETKMGSLGGAANVMSTLMDTAAGSFKAFTSSLETAKILIGESFLPLLRPVTDGLRELLGAFIQGPAFLHAFAAAAIAVSGVLLTLAGGMSLFKALGMKATLGEMVAGLTDVAGTMLPVIALAGAFYLAWEHNFLGFQSLVRGVVSDVQTFADAFGKVFGTNLRRTDPLSAVLASASWGAAAINLQGLSRWFDQLAVSSHAVWLQFSVLAGQVMPSLNAAWRELGLANDHVVTGVQDLLAGDVPGMLRNWHAALTEVQFAWSDVSTAIGKVVTAAGGIAATIAHWVLTVGVPDVINGLENAGAWIQGKLDQIGSIAARVASWVMNVAVPAAINGLESAGKWIADHLGNVAADVKSWTLNVAAPAAIHGLESLGSWLQDKLGTAGVQLKSWALSVGVPAAIHGLEAVGSWIQAKLGTPLANLGAWFLSVPAPQIIGFLDGAASKLQLLATQLLGQPVVDVLTWTLHMATPDVTGFSAADLKKVITDHVHALGKVSVEVAQWGVILDTPDIQQRGAGGAAAGAGSSGGLRAMLEAQLKAQLTDPFHVKMGLQLSEWAITNGGPSISSLNDKLQALVKTIKKDYTGPGLNLSLGPLQNVSFQGGFDLGQQLIAKIGPDIASGLGVVSNWAAALKWAIGLAKPSFNLPTIGLPDFGGLMASVVSGLGSVGDAIKNFKLSFDIPKPSFNWPSIDIVGEAVKHFAGSIGGVIHVPIKFVIDFLQGNSAPPPKKPQQSSSSANQGGPTNPDASVGGTTVVGNGEGGVGNFLPFSTAKTLAGGASGASAGFGFDQIAAGATKAANAIAELAPKGAIPIQLLAVSLGSAGNAATDTAYYLGVMRNSAVTLGAAVADTGNRAVSSLGHFLGLSESETPRVTVQWQTVAQRLQGVGNAAVNATYDALDFAEAVTNVAQNLGGHLAIQSNVATASLIKLRGVASQQVFSGISVGAAAAAAGIGTFAARTVSSVASTAGLSAAASAAGAAIGRFATQAATSAASTAVFAAQLAAVKSRVDSFTAGVTSGMQSAIAAVASAGASIRAAAELIGLSLAAAGTSGGLQFANGIGLGALQAAADMASAGAAIEGIATSIMGALAAAGSAAGASFAAGIAAGMAVAEGAAAAGVGAIIAICSAVDLFGAGFATGASFGAGVAAGLASEEGAVAAEASAIVATAAAASAAAAQIHSPSRLFRDKIGVPIAQGVAVGIREGATFVQDAARSLISLPTLPSTYNASGAVYGPSGGITVSPSITVNLNGTTTDPSELAAQVAEKIGPVLVHIGTQIRRGQGALR